MTRLAVYDLLRLARAGSRSNPVFIVGEARCGTTLLYRLLQQQPDFGPDPVQLTESGFLATLLTQPELDEAHTWGLKAFLNGKDNWDRFVRGGAPLLSLRRAVLRCRPDTLCRPGAATLLGTSLLAQAYVALAAESRGVTRLVEKTPYHTPFAGHLLRWFPRARLLYLVRHPVDAVTSYWRRAAEDPEGAAWAAIDVPTFVDRYATNTALASRLAAERPDAFMVLRYEDLVARPSEVVADVCRFVGAEIFDPHVMSPVPIQQPNREPRVWGEISRVTKNWRDFIDEPSAADVERRLTATLDRLGYDRYTS